MFKHLALFAILAIACSLGFFTLTARPALAQSDKQGLNDQDKDFIKEAAQGGQAEVKMGQLAAEKGSSAEVKSFGQKMVEDHGKANTELMTLAQSKGVTLQEGDLGKHQKSYDKLQKLSGADFDKAYVKMMVEDHQNDVKAFQKEAERGQDHDVKTWAAKTLPTLQMHMSMIDDIDKSMRGKDHDKDKDMGNK